MNPSGIKGLDPDALAAADEVDMAELTDAALVRRLYGTGTGNPTRSSSGFQERRRGSG